MEHTAEGTAGEGLPVSETLEIAEHRTLEYDARTLLAGEGPSREDALAELMAAARETKANALLGLKLTCRTHRLTGRTRYAATAMAAIIDGPAYRQPNGAHPHLDAARARVNSPNGAQSRYLAVLLIALLFIAVPCALRTAQLLGLRIGIGLTACGILVLLAVILILFRFPNARRHYLLRADRRHAV